MSRFISASVLLALVIALCVYTLITLNIHKEELFSSLDVIISTAEQEDYGTAQTLSKRFDEQWTAFEKMHMRYIRKHQLDSITMSSARLASLATQESRAEFLAELHSVRAQIYHLWEGEQPIWRNLF